MDAKRLIRDWALVISMIAGVMSYLIYVNIPWLSHTRAFAIQAVAIAQPVLIFFMLFFAFCRVNLREMRLCRWHLWLLLIQGGSFCALGSILMEWPQTPWRVVVEGAMICMVCPTATASPVITKKLGGDIAHITTYIILVNLMDAILIPMLLPYVHPQPGMSMANATMLILGKVFPLLLMPLFLTLMIRFLWPKLLNKLAQWTEASFYLWLVALALAMVVTVRSIAHSTVPVSTQMWLVVVSLISCILQFRLGRHIGARYDDKVTAGQALGQKNTVFGIWLGYTFFTPITSLADGFYTIWHNLMNSYQLYKHNKNTK